MTVRAHAVTLECFLELGGPFLFDEPVLNNVILTVAAGHRDGTMRPSDADRWWLVRDGDAVRGAAMRTAGHGLLLAAPTPPEVALALADAQEAPIPEATAGVEAARLFAGRLCGRTGWRAGLDRSSRIYRLGTLVPPAGVPGRARQAVAGDRDLLVEWSAGFAAEAQAGRPVGDAAGPIDLRLGRDGLLWLWESESGEPVSMAWVTPPVAGVVRISGVFTPVVSRGRGHASACVAAASAYRPELTCMLYTDLSNPTSNRIYRQIGYQPVVDCDSWRFTV